MGAKLGDNIDQAFRLTLDTIWGQMELIRLLRDILFFEAIEDFDSLFGYRFSHNAAAHQATRDM